MSWTASVLNLLRLKQSLNRHTEEADKFARKVEVCHSTKVSRVNWRTFHHEPVKRMIRAV